MKYILIDGTSMLMTAYYGSAPFREENESDEEYYSKLLQTSSGVYTNAVSVMLKSILHILKLQKPNGLAVAFDSGRKSTFRAKMYSDYKGTRKEAPEPIKQQIKTMEDILTQLNIPVYFQVGYEADDIVCSLVNKLNDGNNEIIVISKDHDYYQLVTDNVVLWQAQTTAEKAINVNRILGWTDADVAGLPPKYIKIDKNGVVKLEELLPCQIPDYKGIAGDKSDNIPGILGIGEKSAKKLLNIYNSLEGIYTALITDEEDFINTCKINKIRNPVKHLKSGISLGFLSLELATMSTEAAENIDLSILKVPDENNLNLGIVKIAEKFEMKSLLNYL